MEQLTELTKLSPALLLMFALNILGLGLKRTPRFPTWLIPLALPVVGAIVYPLICDMYPLPYMEKAKHVGVLCGVVGFGVGGLAVWGHQALTTFLQRGMQNGSEPAAATPVKPS